MKYLVLITPLCALCEGNLMQDLPTKSSRIERFTNPNNSNIISDIALTIDTIQKRFLLYIIDKTRWLHKEIHPAFTDIWTNNF